MMIFKTIKSPAVAGLLTLAVSACATAKRHEAFDSAVTQAFNELEFRGNRSPAGALPIDRGSSLQKLRGRTEILVFPKLSNQSAKSRGPRIRFFGSPIRFAVTAQRLVNCRKLLAQKIQDSSHQAYFGTEVDPSLDCAILEIKQIAPEIKAGNRRNGDLLAARLYLDSNYQSYGIDWEIYRGRGASDISRVKLDPSEPSSSGLSIFPIDLPHLNSAPQDAAVGIPKDPYVRSKMKRFGASGCSSAPRYQYRDTYGSKNTVSWCDGAAWPTTIDTPRYFAITVRK
ncbi:MAG: hypothetical protein RJB38_1500 [Pseudomonadota bacterium]|jgi:hypothetical protein